MTLRNALVDLTAVVAADADILSYLAPRTEGIMKVLAPKPNSIDAFNDATINTALWEAVGTVTEQAWLGVNGLSITGPATAGYDAAGVIYKPAIPSTLGSMVTCRAILDRPIEFVFSLQEYAFTVDSVVTPTTWTLKHDVAQALKNSMGLRWAPGALYFFEGGSMAGGGGTEEYVSELPTKLSATGEIYYLETTFIFTSTGWLIYANIPGVWAAPKLVKTYSRPGGSHELNGYSFCVDKYTADDNLHFTDLAWNFKSNVAVTGARMITANTTDHVNIGSIAVETQQGVNAGQGGTIFVRVPDYSATLLTLEELAEITLTMTGKQVYPIEFELNGDIGLVAPVRFTVDDMTLPTTSTVTGE